MKRVIIIILFLFFYKISKSQNIIGKYIGYDFQGSTYRINKKGKHIKQEINKVAKTLQLNKDSTFSVYFSQPCGLCTQGAYNKLCTGKWTFLNDTLSLSSTFKPEDFYEVRESVLSTSEKDLIKISNIYKHHQSTSDSYHGSIEIFVNFENKNDFKSVGECAVDDTLYFKGKTPYSIKISNTGYQYVYRWMYFPKSKFSNFFSFTLKRSCNGENIQLSNYKLLLSNDEFKPLNYGALDVDYLNNYHKQKQKDIGVLKEK